MPSKQAGNMSALETDNGVLNLSNRGVKKIEHLSKGISPSTLLLSNNEISKVENLQYFTHLQQLSLSGNHIVDMRGISAAQGLRVLDLSNNSILCIEGVSSLIYLEWLNLSGNSIEEIENLDNNTDLTHLDLSDNSIAVISGLRTLMKLKTLLLHGNMISSLAVIKEHLSSTVCTLSLADNEISDLNEMLYLSCLANLQQLSLVNNPCVLPSNAWRLEICYRPYLVYSCPDLRNLDGQLVSHQERTLARLLNQAFHQIRHPSLGQHIQLVSILHHICNEPITSTKISPVPENDDLDGENLLESESFYIPLALSDLEQTQQTQSDDPIMTEEEAVRLLSLAATIIQAHVRGYLVRKKFNFCQFRRRKHAAACIQAAWRGYCARTKDIKVVNIRNELRIRRLISVITNLHSKMDRQHEEAIKSREQLKTAIYYLWCKISEQKKDQTLHVHKKQVKAAITIQSLWRGFMARKAFPNIKKRRSDKMGTLFALCYKLQTQLNMVTSQIKEITQGEKQNKETQMFSDREEPSAVTFATLTGKVNSTGISTGHQLVTEEDKVIISETCEKKNFLSKEEEELKNGVPISRQIGSEDDILETSSTDQLNQGNFIIPLTSPHVSDLKVKEPFSSSLEFKEDTKAMETLSHFDDADGCESGNVVLPFGPVVAEISKVAPSVSNVEIRQNEMTLPPSIHQEEPDDFADGQIDEPKVNVTLSEGSCSNTEYTLHEAHEQEADMEGHLNVGIPEIVVSSPVPTDDESSNEGSVNDVDEDSGQVESKQQKMEKQGFVEGPSEDNQASSTTQVVENDKYDKSTTTDQTDGEQMGRKTQNDSEEIRLPFRSSANVVVLKQASGGEYSTDVAGESNRDPSQESALNLGERASSLLSQLRSEIASMKSARLSGLVPNIASDVEAEVMEEEDVQVKAKSSVKHDNIATASSESQETDLAENKPQDRLSSEDCEPTQFGSQVRDTTQTAPHDVALPGQAFQVQERDKSHLDSKGRDTVQSPLHGLDASVSASSERDSSPPGLVSTVSYRLPLFEDVDSASTSLSLDDLISDPTIEGTVNLPFNTACYERSQSE